MWSFISFVQTKLNQLTSYIPPPTPQTPTKNAKILLVHCHPNPESFSAAIASQVETSARAGGHETRRISLYSTAPTGVSRRKTFTLEAELDYRPNLSRKERELYHHVGEDIDKRDLEPDVKEHLRLLKWCDTLVLVYPTWWMNTPASLKGFFDRSLVHDIAWSLPSITEQEAGGSSTGLVPKLTNIRRIVGISTYGAPFNIVTLSGDNGRRMIANAIRPILSPEATVTWLGLYNMDHTTSAHREKFLNEVDNLVREI